MKEFSITSLAQIINAEPEKDIHKEHRFTGVSIDSRTIRPGDCFFAVTGANFDGHDFVSEAFAGGAVCAVVTRAKSKSINAPNILKVNDTIEALGAFAAAYRRQMNFKVVAITGSVGKTTTRQIAYHILSDHFCVAQAPGSFNNNIGLPLTLLNADPEDEIVIAELGSNHPGEIALLSQIAQPDVALVTNIYPAHLEGFGDLQTIVREKLSIADHLSNDAALLINADCKILLDGCTKMNRPFTTFGTSELADIKAEDIILTGFAARFTINGTEIELPLPGLGNVENALAAWAICSRFGITCNDFARSAKTLSPVPMRTELLQIGNLTVINDCYNANPASMKNALDLLTHLNSSNNRRLVFICGEMAELAQQSRTLHAELGLSVTRAKVELLLTIGRLAKITAQTAKENAQYPLQTEEADMRAP